MTLSFLLQVYSYKFIKVAKGHVNSGLKNSKCCPGLYVHPLFSEILKT